MKKGLAVLLPSLPRREGETLANVVNKPLTMLVNACAGLTVRNLPAGFLVFEVTNTGEDHGDVLFVASRNHFRVAH